MPLWAALPPDWIGLLDERQDGHVVLGAKLAVGVPHPDDLARVRPEVGAGTTTPISARPCRTSAAAPISLRRRWSET